MAVVVAVQILGDEYQVSCEEGEVDALKASAQDLDARMRRIRDSGRVFGVDRIAVLAALNMAHDSVLASGKLADAEGVIHQLIDRVSHALDNTDDAEGK